MTWHDMVIAKDKCGLVHSVYNNDPRYLSGELVGIAKGMLNVRDNDGSVLQISVNDERYLSGELNPLAKGKVCVIDKTQNIFQVDKKDERYLSGELISTLKNKIMVKDIHGNISQVDKNDERYLSGELNFIWKDKKHTDITKQKITDSLSGDKNHMYGKQHTIAVKDKIRNKLAISFFIYTVDGNFISEEKGVKIYAKANNISASNIFKVLNGTCKQSGGYRYFYEYMGQNCNNR